MKIFIISILILLFALRVINTPNNLSKKLYMKKAKKNFAQLNKNPEEDMEMKFGAIVVLLILEIFFMFVYGYVGRTIGTNYFIITSATQIATCFVTLYKSVKEFDDMGDIDKIKFDRWWLLLNTIIDYMYYPAAIYMLCKI